MPPLPPGSDKLTRASGFLFAFGISIAFTYSRTLAVAYGYDALKTGLVLLSFGAGCIVGTFFGGRWSDRELCRLTHANGGHHLPEVRLPTSAQPPWALPPLRTFSDTTVDALRKHETGSVIPSTYVHHICMARTKIRARLHPMHLALLSRLLLHVNYNKSHP
jgi:hypothetical protein